MFVICCMSCCVSVSTERGCAVCIWQVKVFVYCARRMPAHLRCAQCAILLHLIDISFLPYICLWQISQIQTGLCVVVKPGFVSTAPAFMRSSTIHPVGAYDRFSILGGGRRRKNLLSGLPDHCDSSTVCSMCRLDPALELLSLIKNMVKVLPTSVLHYEFCLG